MVLIQVLLSTDRNYLNFAIFLAERQLVRIFLLKNIDKSDFYLKNKNSILFLMLNN